MAERLTCAECGAVQEASEPVNATRCGACGSRRFAGPRDVFARPWVLGGAVAIASVIVILLTALALTIPVGMLASAGLQLPGEGDRRVRSLDRQWDLIRDAERGLPAYPGASRVGEQHGTLAGGQARSLSVCWAAPADYETVLRFYVSQLQEKGSGWQAVAGGTRAFRKGRVYLVIAAPGAVQPPCDGTYQLNFAYQV